MSEYIPDGFYFQDDADGGRLVKKAAQENERNDEPISRFEKKGIVFEMKPSIGQIVHYWPRGEKIVPQAAIITCVWSDTCVNLAIFDGNGNPIDDPPTSILLVQEGNEVPNGGHYCSWPAKV